jgi:purine-binding chemotaxis protein CheW
MREEAEPLAEGNRNRARTGGINWAQIHQRLETIRTTVERRLAPNPDETQAILRARAKLLAREPDDNEEPAPSFELVEFLLAHEHYCIESKHIREIHPLRDLTPLPCVPPFVLGLINVRGQILSIVDLKRFFELPEKGLTDLNRVIIARIEQMEIGILADAILGVRSIALRDLQPSLPTLTGIRAEYLKGVTKDALVVLNLEKILSDPRLIVNDEVSDRA